MFKYLKAAFLTKKEGVPVNLLYVAVIVGLGFIHPAFWIVGTLLELFFLLGLATNERFCQLVDGLHRAEVSQADEVDITGTLKKMVRKLLRDEHMRYKHFRYTCDRVLKLYTEKDADTITVDDHHLAFKRLEWRYLKMLLARSRMQSRDFTSAPVQVKAEIDELKQELKNPMLAEALRHAKAARLETLDRRFEILGHRDQALEEIDVYLARIDEKLKLLLEQAGLHSTPAEIAAEFDSSSLHLDGIFGDDETAVESTDRFYEQTLEEQS